MKRILVIGDRQHQLEKGDNVLSRPYLEVFSATSSEEALKIHREQKMDLIIADLDMPGISGDELCSRIRKKKEWKDVSLILVCRNEEVTIERCKACGANAILTTPVDPNELVKKVIVLLRISERKGMRVLTKLAVDGGAENRFFLAHSQNISTTGILLFTDHVLKQGDTITLSFYLLSKHITVKGQIARVTKLKDGPFQYGVKFVSIDPQSKSMIERFIENGYIG